MVNSQDITVTCSSLPYEMRALCLNPLQHTMALTWFFLFLSVKEKRSVSPTHSCVSMKSDASKDLGSNFREGELPSEQRYVDLLLPSHPHITYVLHRAGHILTACSIQQQHKHLEWTIQSISSSHYTVYYLRLVHICNLLVILKKGWRLPKSSNVWFPYSDGLE